MTDEGDPQALQPDLGDPLGLTSWSLGCWMNLFGVKPLGKSSFPKIKNSFNKEKGIVALEVPSELIDHNIQSMAMMLVGKFMGTRSNINLVKTFTRKKWDLKG